MAIQAYVSVLKPITLHRGMVVVLSERGIPYWQISFSGGGIATL